MRSRRPLLVLSAAIAGSFPCAQAHHGQEFLVVQDAAVPSLWTGVAFGSLEWSKDGDDNTFSTEPGVMVGIAPRVAIGGTVGFTDENGSWAFESVAPTMQIQLTPSDWRVRVSVVAGYHFAYSSTESTASPPATSTTSTTSTAPPPTRAPPPPPPPPHGPPPPPSRSLPFLPLRILPRHHPPARPPHPPHPPPRPRPPPSSRPPPPTTAPSIPIPSPADQNSARMPHPAPTQPPLPQVENSGTPSTRHQPLLRHPHQEKASPLPKNRLHRPPQLPHPRPLPRPIRMMAFTAITKIMPSPE